MIQNLIDLSRKLASGRLSSSKLVRGAFEQIDAAGEQGTMAFLNLYRDAAMAQASLVDEARQLSIDVPPFAGIPIAIKDLFDISGEVTRAGSRVLDEKPPAEADAEAVRRLRRAGFIVIGKNNMTEFAYSGLGVNGHFGTPLNPHDGEVDRIPGGSSSGAAVAIAQSMVPAALGTDTGGSCRIPAAFCGVVGFKPTSGRVPTAGSIPLSKSLDCVGPLATSVSCCAVLDSILSGGVGDDVEPLPEGGIRLGVLEGYATEKVDATVSNAFQAALTRLSHRGVRLTPVELTELSELPAINGKGGFVGAEAYAWHRDLLEARGDCYDPWVRARFDAGRSQSAADYILLGEHRARIRASIARKQQAFDALILPTVQIAPPPIADLRDTEFSNKTNLLCLRNTAVGNFLDLPAISIPCHGDEGLPVGSMLMGMSGDDRRLLSVARSLEQTIRGNIAGGQRREATH